MRVSFRDEGFTKIVGGSDEVSNIMKRVSVLLQDGIYVGRFHYQFLTSTSSQIRDHSVWFVRSNLLKDDSRNSAKKIRDWMGDFSGWSCALLFTLLHLEFRLQGNLIMGDSVSQE